MRRKAGVVDINHFLVLEVVEVAGSLFCDDEINKILL